MYQKDTIQLSYVGSSHPAMGLGTKSILCSIWAELSGWLQQKELGQAEQEECPRTGRLTYAMVSCKCSGRGFDPKSGPMSAQHPSEKAGSL